MTTKKSEMSQSQIDVEKRDIEDELKKLRIKKVKGRFVRIKSERMQFMQENHPDMLDPFHLIP